MRVVLKAARILVNCLREAPMDRFKNWLVNFMSGRYGFDELGQSMSVWVIVLIIVSIVLSLLTGLFYNLLHIQPVAVLLAILSKVANWAGLIVLVIMAWRMLSRKHDKRRAENGRYLARKSKAAGKSKSRRKWGKRSKSKDISQDTADFLYLDCPFCGQKMRVPRGKGKIAVKCPSCGERTIANS